MKEKLEAIRNEAIEKIQSVDEIKKLQKLKVTYLGKKGSITSVLRGMGKLTKEERPVIGKLANKVQETIAQSIQEKQAIIEQKAMDKQLQEEAIDVTLPGRPIQVGGSHLLTNIVHEIEDLFIGMGFEVKEGPQVETDYYNFEALNLPKNHPARDMQDSFYITNELLLRTHTSPVQARTMRSYKGEKPVKMICPGVVYRRDSDDATHSHQFNQIEGLYVDKDVRMSDLKGMLNIFAKKCLEKIVKSVSVQVSSRLLNHLLKWIYHVKYVLEKGVLFVRKQAGLKY